MKILEMMDFAQKWWKWMKQWISTVCFSVLFNGSPTGFFQMYGGPR